MSNENPDVLEIIRVKKRRLHELKKRAALEGSTVDPSVTIEIEDLELEIPELVQDAEQVVSTLGLPSSVMTTGSIAEADGPRVAAQHRPPDLGATVSGLIPDQLSTAVLPYQWPALVLDPPPIQPWVSHRRETVAGLAADANGTTWFCLNGVTSRGKTVLSRLLAETLGGTSNWLQFAGLSDVGASSLFEQFCVELTNQLPPPGRDPWYHAACEAVGTGAVLVLDDLPNLSSSPMLASRLPPFIRACADVGIHVLSSSLFPVPQRVQQELDGLVIDRATPPFTDGEAEDVLAAFGAPANTVRLIAKLINAVARQHPTLLVAACRYLQSLHWNLGENELEAIFKGTYTANIADEVHQKLKGTVPDPDTRRLLYRLTLIAGPFTWHDVDALASVSPLIDSAREKLRDVLNSWVEERPDGQYVVSGLLTPMGRDNLSAPVTQNCNLALAEAIIAQGEMDQNAAFLAVTYYQQGREFTKAGNILLMSLSKAFVMIQNEAFEHTEWIRNDALLLLWTNSALPVEMDLNIRLIVRGVQIALFHKLQKPLDFLFDDFNGLIASATEVHRFGVAGAVSYIIMAVGRKYPMEAGSWLRRFLQLPNPVPPSQPVSRNEGRAERQQFELNDEIPLDALIWMLVGELATAVQVGDWLDTVQTLPTDVLARVMTKEESHIGSIIVADSLTRAEQAKASGDRDWLAVIVALTNFSERAKEMQCEILWACFVRANITVQAEYCCDVDGALATADQASQLTSLDPLIGFLIEGTIGRQVLLAKRYEDARIWLKRAVERNAETVFAYERANILLAASHAFGIEDPMLGVKYAADATTVAESDANMPAIERARAWCERGVAEFLALGVSEAFSSWDHAGEYLFSMTERTDFWKELMVLFGHMSGYLAKIAETGEPPMLTLDGEPYTPPERGVFMTTNASRIAFFNVRREGALWRILAYYADAVGDAEMSKKWKERASDIGKRDSLLALVAEAERENIPNVLQEDGYSAALEAGRRSGQAMVVFEADTEAGGLGTVTEAELPVAITQLSDIRKLSSEEFGMIVGLVPCVLSVATLAIRAETLENAREQASQLALACRDVAPGSLAPARWELMAELVERAYVEGASSTEMMDWSKSLSGDQPDSFKVLVRLAACADATPSNSAVCMLSFMPLLSGWFPPGIAVHRKLLAPFVVSYWTHKFEQQRFLFDRPRVVEPQLSDAIAAPEDDRVVAVLKAIHSGITFAGPMPEEVRLWLYG